MTPVAKGSAGVVDQEAGGVGCDGREVASLIGQRHQCLDVALIGALAAHHFDDLHQRNGVEEVETGNPLRVLGGAGDAGDRQRGGVGSQYAVFADNGFKVGKQFLFDFQQLDDGLDDQIAVFQLFQCLGRLHAGNGGFQLGFGHLALGLGALQQVAVKGQCILDCLGAGIEQQNLLTAAGEQLGDAATHCSGADDANPLEHALPPGVR